MTLEELKAAANKLGYVVKKKPVYQCSCYLPYPNECLKRKNGKWRCVDKYRPIESGGLKTKCVRIEAQKIGE